MTVVANKVKQSLKPNESAPVENIVGLRKKRLAQPIFRAPKGSPDGEKRNPGLNGQCQIPGLRKLHPGYASGNGQPGSGFARPNQPKGAPKQRHTDMYIYKGVILNKSDHLPISCYGHKCLKTKSIWM